MSMLTSKLLLFTISCLLAALAGIWFIRKKKPAAPELALLLFLLPFASGCFYSFWAVPVSVWLLWILFRQIKKSRSLHFCWDWTTVAVCAVFLGYLLSNFWAVDHGMAIWGPVRTLPLVLYVLALRQIEPEARQETLSFLPVSGALMTVLSFVMQLFPFWHDYIILKGRLTGFFEYANTYALFLLVCLIIVLCSAASRRKMWILTAILIFGILASGSRTVLALTVISLILLCVLRRNRTFILYTLLALFLGAAVFLALDYLQVFEATGRVLATQAQDTSLLSRLLYYKDALPVILRHPLGLGYYGYLTAQLGFQTGVYNVTFVHNELLQLLLDIGWIPSILICIALIRGFFCKSAGLQTKLLIFVILAHCMLDFDLQFTVIWLILLTLLPLSPGNMVRFQKPAKVLAASACISVLLCAWLGIGDFCYTLGLYDACLAVTPFHTISQQQRLSSLTTPETQLQTAEQILRLCDTSAFAHSAKANVAFSQGDIATMITEKELAIACNYYNLDLYCEYFELLNMAGQIFLQQGDVASAEICQAKMQQIPTMLAEIEANTSPLAWKLEHTPELMLPDTYLNQLTGTNQ